MNNKFSQIMRQRQLIETTKLLRSDIDDCITKLCNARLEGDKHREQEQACRMEQLMVATLQQLDCINEFIKLKIR